MMMRIFGRAQGKEVARRLAFFCLGSERLPRQPGVPAGPERFQPPTRDTHNQLALVWPPFRALQMASAEMLLWSCSAHNRLQLRKLLKASVTSAVKTMKSHFFTQVPHSDPRNPQNASWGKEPISFSCLSSLGVLSGYSDASGSRPPPGLWLMLLVPREGQLSAGLSDPPPLKVPKPWRLEPRSPCSWSQRFGQNGPAHSATCWSVIARRSGLPAREEGAWLLIIPDCSSQPPHKHLIYSLHPSHTSNVQGRKTGGEEKHKR